MFDELVGGRYRVTSCLRTTDFGETYIAEDIHFPGNPHPRCVVKKLQPQSDEEFVLENARRLFDNEAKVLYKLNGHQQIPRLLAHIVEEFCLVQEYIEGKDLSRDEIVPGREWQEAEVKRLLIDVLKILAFVHQNNVIHRDVKPSNLIRRASDGKIFLIDFGSVKEINSMTLTEGQGHALTIVVGTPGYMASEQQRGDPRFNSDIYALGMTAIEAITGTHPNLLPRDRDTGEVKWRDLAADCSDELARVLDKMVRNDFLQRYKNASEALEDLCSPRNESASSQKILPLKKSSSFIFKRASASKRLLLLFALPLSLGLLFLTFKIWKAVRALKFYNQGNELIESGKYESAILSFNRALANRSDLAQAWTNKGFAQGKLNRHLEKFSSCIQATDAAPDFAEAWNCRGLARFDLKQYEQALKEYNQAIAIDPGFYRGWYNKGQVLLELGQPKEAEAAAREVLRVKPDYFLAWTQLCRALYDQQRYQDAKAHCEESLNLKPDYAPTSTMLEKVEEKLN